MSKSANEATSTSSERMSNAIGVWVDQLQNYPGFKEWDRSKVGAVLWFDDPFKLPANSVQDQFKFSDKIEREHALIMAYMHLQQTIFALKDCEYYFRRYPFRGLPITRYQHMTTVCEMYFSRFYEFKSRIKNYFEALKNVNPSHGLDIGNFIKVYDRIFDAELRERNNVHHRERFVDIAIDRLFMTELMAQEKRDKGWKQENLIAYRKASQEWVRRVRKRGAKLDEFLEAVAEATLRTCPFVLAALGESHVGVITPK